MEPQLDPDTGDGEAANSPVLKFPVTTSLVPKYATKWPHPLRSRPDSLFQT